MLEKFVQSAPYPAPGETIIDKPGKGAFCSTDRGNHEAAIKMVKMQNAVFGAVADSSGFIAVIGS